MVLEITGLEHHLCIKNMDSKNKKISKILDKYKSSFSSDDLSSLDALLSNDLGSEKYSLFTDGACEFDNEYKPINAGIGINKGKVISGNIGSKDQMDYTVIGGGVNMAARLESAAEANSILLSYDTYNLIKDEVPCIESDKIKLKGITQPVRTFKVFNETNDESILSIRMESSQFNAKLCDLSANESKDLKLSLENALEKLNKHLENSPDVAC